MTRLNKIRKRIADSKRLTVGLKTACTVLSALVAAIFAFAITVLLVFSEYEPAMKLALSAAVGFILVTLVRKLINAPRPYELLDFYNEPPKNKKGASFPSRHVYSAFCIATLMCAVSTLFAAVLFFFAVCISVLRVLLGIHFIRDVLCGALIGAIAGAIGIATLSI